MLNIGCIKCSGWSHKHKDNVSDIVVFSGSGGGYDNNGHSSDGNCYRYNLFVQYSGGNSTLIGSHLLNVLHKTNKISLYSLLSVPLQIISFIHQPITKEVSYRYQTSYPASQSPERHENQLFLKLEHQYWFSDLQFCYGGMSVSLPSGFLPHRFVLVVPLMPASVKRLPFVCTHISLWFLCFFTCFY